MSFSLQVTPDVVALEPGATTPITVVIVNKGVSQDRYEMEIEGIDPEWKAVPVPVFAADPGETHSEKVFFKPPRASESLAGNYPFVVRVRSLQSGEQRTVQGVAQVRPFHHLSMEINPKKGVVSPYRKQNSFDVTLVNLGNTEHTLQLLGSDPEDACAYEFDQEQVAVGPGQQRDVEVTAVPTSTSILSGGRLIGFSVTGRSIDSPSVVSSAQAQLEQRPLITPAALGVFVLLAVLFGAWLAMMPKPPTIQFSVEPRQITRGDQVAVSWIAENARRVTIMAGEELVYEGPELRGTRTFVVGTDGTVTFRAVAQKDEMKKDETQQVVVKPPVPVPGPRIARLAPDRRRIRVGEPFVMRYQLSQSVTEAVLQPTGTEIDKDLSEIEITPNRTGRIEYTLVAKNAVGETVRKSFEVEVYDESDARILAFGANNKTIRTGEEVVISWQVNGAERVELKASGSAPTAVASIGSQPFTLDKKTTFTLTAIDAKGRRTVQNVTVTVQAPPPPPPVDTTTGGDTGTTTADPTTATTASPTTGGTATTTTGATTTGTTTTTTTGGFR